MFYLFERKRPDVGKAQRERILQRIRDCMSFWKLPVEFTFLDTKELVDGSICHFYLCQMRSLKPSEGIETAWTKVSEEDKVYVE